MSENARPRDGQASGHGPEKGLDQLLVELQSRINEAVVSRERLRSLLEAVVTIGTGLDLQSTLRRIVEAAMNLAGARDGALGVFGSDGRLEQFLPLGLDAEDIARIERRPEGRGITGPQAGTARPLRLKDISHHPGSYGFPEGHPSRRGFLRVPIQVRGEVFGCLYLAEKQGGDCFDEEDESIVVAFATAAGAAIENARLHERTRRRETWLDAADEVTTRLLGGEGPDRVLLMIAQRSCRMADADTAAVAIPDGSGRNLVVRAVSGAGAERIRGRSADVGGPLLGRVYVSGEPVTTDVSGSDPCGVPLPRDMGIGPVLLVPLGQAGGVRGVLCLGRRAGAEQFPPPTVQTVHAFAGHAAVALGLAEVRVDAERVSVLEDRDRIARDLHDVVIQRLFAVALSLSRVMNRIDDPVVSERVRQAVDDLDDTVRRIRSTIFALTTVDADRDRSWLRDRIVDVVGAAAVPLGFTAGLRMDGPLDSQVPERVADEVVAVLQEALSNIAQHAGADRVGVRVSVGDDLTVEVTDDGVGISPGGRRSGLRNLSERAAWLGGTFDVGAAPGGGTVLRWVVPLPDDEDTA